jgi:hypothetical protein
MTKLSATNTPRSHVDHAVMKKLRPALKAWMLVKSMALQAAVCPRI